MAVELGACNQCRFGDVAPAPMDYSSGADVDGGSSYFPGAPIYGPKSNLGAGISYGRGTGPGYTHAFVPKPTFPRVPPTRFVSNPTVMMAESPDMFYGLEDDELEGWKELSNMEKGLAAAAAGVGLWWLFTMARR